LSNTILTSEMFRLLSEIMDIYYLQSINARKEEFRKYLEKNGVVESFTRSLVALYEEPERPPNPLE